MSDDLRELDRCVALEVMGWDPEAVAKMRPKIYAFSSDIAQAFEVVERMRELGFHAQIQDFESPALPQCRWSVRFGKTGTNPGSHAEETLPLAICRAALAALEASNV